SRPPSFSTVRDNTGAGVTLGGSADTNPANAGAICALLASLATGPTSPTCGAVDGSVTDVFIANNERGVVVQNGNQDGASDGSFTVVHITGNNVYGNTIHGMLIRPSQFVQEAPQTAGTAEVLTFNDNNIFLNALTSQLNVTAQIEFDGSAFVGAPA